MRITMSECFSVVVFSSAIVFGLSACGGGGSVDGSFDMSPAPAPVPAEPDQPVETSLNSDFETGEFSSYGWSPSGNDTTRIVSKDGHPVCRGDHSARFTLDFDQDDVPFRTQLTLNKGASNEFAIGEEHWISASVYLPADWQPDREEADEVAISLHGRPDKDLDEAWRKGILSIRIKGNQWYFLYSKDAKRNTGKLGKSQVEELGQMPIGQVAPGRWTTFVMQTHYTYEPEGFVKVWMDGEVVAEKRNGIGYNDAVGPYLKIGIYKSYWGISETRDYQENWGGRSDVDSWVLWIDEVRLGDASATYDSMDPRCDSGSTMNAAQESPAPAS